MVLGGDTRSFLSVIRSLGRQNLLVHVGWCPRSSPVLRSRYISKIHQIPPFSIDSDSWKRTLIAIIEQERFDLVIPCNDGTIIPLQMHKDEFEKYTLLALPNKRSFEIAFDKIQSYELARELGLHVPNGMVVSDIADLKAIAVKFELPVIIKPRSSFTADNIHRKNQVCKASDLQALEKHLGYLLSQDKVLVQENFVGTGVGVELLAWQGKVLSYFQHLRIHEPPSGGGSSYRKSVPIDAQLLDATRDLMAALNYTGVAMVEFKMNLTTGDWIFVEINGRFWGSLPLAIASGADFPYYLYQLLVEGKRDFPQSYRTGIHCRNFSNDLGWFIENFRARHSDPTLPTLSIWQIAKEATNVLRLRERNDTVVIDDPKPGWIEIMNFLRNTFKNVIRRTKFGFQVLPLVRNLYRYRAYRALDKSKVVLFVCKGNICRSPFAQYYALSIFGSGVKVVSAGYYPEEGRVCPEEAFIAAKEFGIDLTDHRSQIVTEDLVRESDAIFVFDEDNLRTLNTEYPFSKSKVHCLGFLSLDGPLIIKDPYGGDIEAFRSVYQNIVRKLESYSKTRVNEICG